MDNRAKKLKDTLERLYEKYNRRDSIKPDPLQFVYQYSEPAEMEIVALLAAELAYGRVRQIEKSLTGLLGRLGNSPFEFVCSFDEQSRNKLKNFRHRFTTGDDISDLLELLKNILLEFGSIESFFLLSYNPHDKNIIGSLSKFCDSLLDMHIRSHNDGVPKGLKYLLAGPAGGSACKRLNLFLRWMVRKDNVDLGLWKSIDKAKLVVPLDVHMSRLSGLMGLSSRKSPSLAAAVEITEAFCNIAPSDPVKYDFALTRIGIMGNCRGQPDERCENCRLLGFCS